MTVIIGIDPHKATHTAVAIGCDEGELATVTIRATRQQAVLPRQPGSSEAVEIQAS